MESHYLRRGRDNPLYFIKFFKKSSLNMFLKFNDTVNRMKMMAVKADIFAI